VDKVSIFPHETWGKIKVPKPHQLSKIIFEYSYRVLLCNLLGVERKSCETVTLFFHIFSNQDLFGGLACGSINLSQEYDI
jgi:hypothetical protein